MTGLSEQERERYERHMFVDGFTEEQQEKLKAARVIVVGAGGLGSAVLQYLAASGVGAIGIVEFDTVAPSNLQRQVLYSTADLGGPKIEIAAERLQALNPHSEITTFGVRLDDDNAADILNGFHMVIDCTDNYASRYLIDRAAGKLGIPMIYGTAQESRGQVSVFHYGGAGGYADLYPETDPEGDKKPVGVLSPIPGLVGMIQAMEAIKLITGYGKPLVSRLLVFDTATMDFNVYQL